MKNILLKSNHGNHSGFNRKYEILDQSEDINDLKSLLRDQALRCSDDMSLDENGNVIDGSRDQEVLLSHDEDRFVYDGRFFIIVTQDMYDQGFFNGSCYGYANKGVVDYFES